MKACCTLDKDAVGIEMLDGRDLLAVDPDAEIEAAGHRDIVDQHGAAAAQALAAAFARAEQIEALQQFDQIAMRLDGGRDRLAVEREIDDLHAHRHRYHPIIRHPADGLPWRARRAAPLRP